MPDTDDQIPAEPEPAIPPPPPRVRFREPECAIDWDRSNLTPGLLRAIAAAQASISTVGKEAQNTHHRYKYAPADAVVEEMRRAFARCGVALVMSWRSYDPPFQLPEDSSQWIDWHVVCDWALVHGGGRLGFGEDAEVLPAEVGVMRGTAACVALGDKGRGPDKSMLTARTTIHGALALCLAQIDRAEVDPNEEGSGRSDDMGSGRRGAGKQVRLSAEMRERVDQAVQHLNAARRSAGHRIDGKPITLPRTFADLIAPLGPGFVVNSDATAQQVIDAAERALTAVELQQNGGA